MTIVGTRPEIIKLASLIKIFKQKRENFFLVNTNQHYTKIMSKVFFNHFNIPKPKYNINTLVDEMIFEEIKIINENR